MRSSRAVTADRAPLESELVALSAAGDEAAFVELLAPYRRRLGGYFARSGVAGTSVEDLLQETLLKVWLALPGYVDRGSFAGWLFAIARNVCRQTRRHAARRPRLVADDGAERVDPSSPHAALEAAALERRLRGALDALPASQREVFLLRQHGELSFREIARLLDRPLGTVLSAMHRAVEKLRKEIETDVQG